MLLVCWIYIFAIIFGIYILLLFVGSAVVPLIMGSIALLLDLGSAAALLVFRSNLAFNFGIYSFVISFWNQLYSFAFILLDLYIDTTVVFGYLQLDLELCLAISFLLQFKSFDIFSLSIALLLLF